MGGWPLPLLACGHQEPVLAQQAGEAGPAPGTSWGVADGDVTALVPSCSGQGEGGLCVLGRCAISHLLLPMLAFTHPTAHPGTCTPPHMYTPLYTYPMHTHICR